MGVLLYSPGIRVKIESAQHGVIDVTDDLVDGSLSIVAKESSSFNFRLMNHRRKYDRIFTPNDRITVEVKRIRWVRAFTGYLDKVPYFSIHPRTVSLAASDSIKSLRYLLWDPGLPAAEPLLNSNGTGADGIRDTDGGIADKLKALLTEVGEWPAERIHIGGLPPKWLERISGLEALVNERVQLSAQVLGSASTVAGANPAFGGSTTAEGIGPGTGILPHTMGKASYFGGVGTTDATGKMALTGEPGTNPRDPWYCAMRWPYVVTTQSGGPGKPVPGVNLEQAKAWWSSQRLIVVNRKNQKAVILRPADWGPHGSLDRVIDMSKQALVDVLGAGTDADVEIRFAPPGAPLGPYGQVPSVTGVAVTTQPSSIAAQTPVVVQGADGLRFADADGLQSNVAAAFQFVKQSWDVISVGGYAPRNVAGTSKPSDHSKGLALDVMVAQPGTAATGASLQLGNSIAMWFLANPNVFGVSYVIWNDRINTGSGWRSYSHPGGSGNTLQHRDHVHISFEDTGQTAIGPTGSPWVGSAVEDFPAGVGTTPIPQVGAALLNTHEWYAGRPAAMSEALIGYRAIMNDEPLLDTVEALCTAGMRHWMAAPNGDFVAWFPDYFGAYGMAGVVEIRDIEIDSENDGFTIAWSDQPLVTHVFAIGAPTGYSGVGGPAGGDVGEVQEATTRGIVTVEFPEVLQALLNVDPTDSSAVAWLEGEKILRRFGARTKTERLATISGPAAEFWYAVSKFQEHWASQFSTSIDLTFMPEIWPGMLLQFPDYGLQVYVEGVTHSFNFQSGGGFTTTAHVVAPSALAGGGLYGLPRAGAMPEVPASIDVPLAPPTSTGGGVRVQ